MRRRLSLAGFVLIQVVLLPVTLVGGIVYSLCLRSIRRRGAPRTACGVLVARWLMHATRGRDDPAAGQLLRALPGMTPGAAEATTGASILASRLTGLYPSLYRFPPEVPVTSMAGLVGLRTAFFDRALEQRLNVVQQVVILGAGFDTRAYGMLRDRGVQVFEVDRAETQGVKRAALERAGIDAAHVRFVAVDFNRESWIERLEAESFDRSMPTFVLLEGVTYYLEPDAVRETLAALSTLARGSTIAFDYPSLEFVNGQPPFEQQSRRSQRMHAGEPWTFGISTMPPARLHLQAFLSVIGLAPLEWEPVGPDEPDRPAFGGIVMAVVKP